MRDDLVHQTDASLDRGVTPREKFLLDEGLEMLALYRAIGDPDVRLMVRKLLVDIAGGGAREQ